MNNDSEYQDIGYLYLQNNNIPDQDTINGISPNYISNCPNPNFVINSSNPSCHVQDISNFNNTNKNITNVVNIYNSLFDLTLVSEGFKPEDGDEEEKAHLQEIHKFGECIDNFIEKLTKQKEKSLQIEKEFKISYEKTQRDIDKVSDFKDFITKIDTKYIDFIPHELNKSLSDISEKINENNDHKNIKGEFLKQNHILKKYTEVIHKLNSLNNGSTCNLCLQRQVDTYMEPCGHTGCSECIQKLKDRNDNYTCNCFICRREVFNYHKLYFT